MTLMRTAKIDLEYPQGTKRAKGERFAVDSQRDAALLEAMGWVEPEEGEPEPDRPVDQPAAKRKRDKAKFQSWPTAETADA